jgi:hypothetical protein
MTDYRPLLARAIAALDPNTGEARRAVYDRARTALVNQLRGMNPPLAEAEITRQRLALEESIRKVESEATAAPAAATQSRGERPPRQEPPRGEQPPRGAPAPRTMPPPPRAQDAPDDGQYDYENEAPPRDPRDPRGNERPDSRDRGQQPRAEPSLRPRGARGRNPADYAREDARKASRTKLVVFGIILVLLLLASAVGYVNRERIFSIVSGAIPIGTEQGDATTSPAPDKAGDRVPQQTQQKSTAPFSPSTQAAGSGQRAVLFEENPGTQQFTAINGTVTWRVETISPGENRPPELVIHADIEVPDRKLKISFSLRRNPEASSSASHYVYVRFSGDDSFGGIAQVPFIRMKPNESAQGAPLVAISHKVMAGFFLLGLSSIDADRERNITALRTQPWIDVAFVYENGRRSVIAFEKGPAGEKALADALAAWGM